ncbi:MAG: glycoside hydrolase family 43 protein [Acidobacteriaceae bacterium]|nr:glycoside hydrolase family 43 protein [Acidobacteriaceae bacterium]
MGAPRLFQTSSKAVVLTLAAVSGLALAQDTFTNPIRDSGPDPWIEYRDGAYFLMTTTGHDLTIWKSSTLGGLKNAPPHPVWAPPSATAPYASDVWAPELHWMDGKWYIYFAGDADKRNDTHRIWVLENPASDPTEGTWTMKGELADPSDKWAIDPSVFENNGRWYVVWSGWPGDTDGVQNIYIARLKNPWTIEGNRVLLSTPTYEWEEHGPVKVDEGPEVLKHGGKLFLTFSASHCSTDDYELGMLTASADSDLLNPESWKKSARPVFSGSAEAQAFGTGHNGFFESPDGKQDWIVYHANPGPDEHCGAMRSTRAQPFTWNADGTPNFGRPAPLGAAVAAPSGERVH